MTFQPKGFRARAFIWFSFRQKSVHCTKRIATRICKCLLLVLLLFRVILYAEMSNALWCRDHRGWSDGRGHVQFNIKSHLIKARLVSFWTYCRLVSQTWVIQTSLHGNDARRFVFRPRLSLVRPGTREWSGRRLHKSLSIFIECQILSRTRSPPVTFPQDARCISIQNHFFSSICNSGIFLVFNIRWKGRIFSVV